MCLAGGDACPTSEMIQVKQNKKRVSLLARFFYLLLANLMPNHQSDQADNDQPAQRAGQHKLTA